MKFLDSKLTPSVSIGMALGTGAVILGVYSHYLPSVADHRVALPNNPDAMTAERQAAWTSAGLLALVAMLTRDETVFVVGAAEIIALSWIHRHADAVNPATGRATVRGGNQATMTDAAVGNAYADAVDAGRY